MSAELHSAGWVQGLLVSAFASYLAWILIFLGFRARNILIVTGFIIVTPPLT